MSEPLPNSSDVNEPIFICQRIEIGADNHTPKMGGTGVKGRSLNVFASETAQLLSSIWMSLLTFIVSLYIHHFDGLCWHKKLTAITVRHPGVILVV
jgi:hypothetical protein